MQRKKGLAEWDVRLPKTQSTCDMAENLSKSKAKLNGHIAFKTVIRLKEIQAISENSNFIVLSLSSSLFGEIQVRYLFRTRLRRNYFLCGNSTLMPNLCGNALTNVGLHMCKKTSYIPSETSAASRYEKWLGIVMKNVQWIWNISVVTVPPLGNVTEVLTKKIKIQLTNFIAKMLANRNMWKLKHSLPFFASSFHTTWK